MKILVVDDAPDMRLILKKILTDWHYDVTLASDGSQAWEILQHEAFSIVISDWVMPEMDGLELCKRIRGHNFQHYVYLILLTGKNAKDDLITGMEAGADDFATKPLNSAELRVRIRAGQRVIQLESSLEERNEKLEKSNDELSKAYEQISQDLQHAASVQKNLLPPPGTLNTLTMDWVYQPASFIGGDTFDSFDITDHLTVFYCVDVAGHGVPAALLSVSVHNLLHNHGTSDSIWQIQADNLAQTPLLVVEYLNDQFSRDDSDQYFTMVCGIVDKTNQQVHLVQAGHPHPIHWHKHANSSELIGDGGVPVGMLPNMPFDSLTLDYQPGDRLFLYTDGITECENAQQEQFGEEKLQSFISNHQQNSLEILCKNLTADLQAWHGDDVYDDDVTLLAFEFH